MRSARRVLLLLSAISLTCASGSLGEAPGPHPPIAASSASEPATSSPGSSLAGLLTGLAALVTAVGGSYYNWRELSAFRKNLTMELVTDNMIALIRRQGAFLSEQDEKALGKVFLHLVYEHREAVRDHGGFADKKQVDDGMGKLSKRLDDAEQSLLDLAGILNRQKPLDPKAEQRKLVKEFKKRLEEIDRLIEEDPE